MPFVPSVSRILRLGQRLECVLFRRPEGSRERLCLASMAEQSIEAVPATGSGSSDGSGQARATIEDKPFGENEEEGGGD